MKENSELISEISQITFTTFQTCETRLIQARRFINSLKKQVLSYKEQFLNGIATLGIGVILLISIYLFLVQLAENGWQ